METDTLLTLQEHVRTVLTEHPAWVAYLERIIAWEETHPSEHTWDGWEWSDVQAPPAVLNRLVTAGLARRTYHSRSSTHYRLVSLSETREALDMLRNVPVTPPGRTIAVDQLFRLVVGHDRAKLLLRSALEAEQPVHVLLTGPPGTAKTLLLSDIAQLPGAHWYAGSTTTKAGLVGLLLREQPAYLVLDELDKMHESDMTPLLNLMEGGHVTRLQAHHKERISLPTKVFATANDSDRLSQPIRSRFLKIEIPPYTPAEFVIVAQGVLTQREGLGPQMAKLVADETVRYSTDIRDAIRVARLARNRPQDVPLLVRSMFDHQRRDRLTMVPPAKDAP